MVSNILFPFDIIRDIQYLAKGALDTIRNTLPDNTAPCIDNKGSEMCTIQYSCLHGYILLLVSKADKDKFVSLNKNLVVHVFTVLARVRLACRIIMTTDIDSLCVLCSLDKLAFLNILNSYGLHGLSSLVMIK